MFKELIFTFSNFDPCLIYKIVQSVNLIINMSTKILKPPFNEETARAKVKAAQDAWNSRNPELVAQTYTIESRWRNRTEFFTGREAIIAFLKRLKNLIIP
jgi:hypothetical protein